jgi:hypothetical protein
VQSNVGVKAAEFALDKVAVVDAAAAVDNGGVGAELSRLGAVADGLKAQVVVVVLVFASAARVRVVFVGLVVVVADRTVRRRRAKMRCVRHNNRGRRRRGDALLELNELHELSELLRSKAGRRSRRDGSSNVGHDDFVGVKSPLVLIKSITIVRPAENAGVQIEKVGHCRR